MTEFATLVAKAEKHLGSHEDYDGSINLDIQRGTGYAILAHAKAMENIAKALELNAKMQSRPSM